MNFNGYDDIKIPENIDIKIHNGVQKAILETSEAKINKKKKLTGAICATIALILALGIANPALAAKLPIIGNVFEAIEKNLFFPGNYSQYATSVNETTTSNGVDITLSEILCDGQYLYVTYIVENKDSFKYTSWGNTGKMDMNQLITEESYNKVNFSNIELDGSGFAGLEGKFINENTFVGVKKYNLDSLNTEIPSEFIFQTKIIYLENCGINNADKSYKKIGSWAFKVPVTVNKNLRKNIEFSQQKNDLVTINSISLSPFNMILDINYKLDDNYLYKFFIYDENGDLLRISNQTWNSNKDNHKITTNSPNIKSNSIRIVIEKQNESTKETVYDSIISLKKQ